MQDTWDYIEAYFAQTLSGEDKKNFELRVEQDAAFAKEVAFYVTTRKVLQEMLAEKQQRDDAGNSTEEKAIQLVPAKKYPLRNWIVYAAAACIVLFISINFLVLSPAPQQLANRYIKDNYTLLHKTMDASHDSMQVGIMAYEKQDYGQAQAMFDGLRHSHPEMSDAKKFAGLAYLQTKNYDKALECFEALAAMNDRYNSGDMLQAVTLLQRNSAGDKERAKALLEKVVKENEEGADEAKTLLEKL